MPSAGRYKRISSLTHSTSQSFLISLLIQECTHSKKAMSILRVIRGESVVMTVVTSQEVIEMIGERKDLLSIQIDMFAGDGFSGSNFATRVNKCHPINWVSDKQRAMRLTKRASDYITIYDNSTLATSILAQLHVSLMCSFFLYADDRHHVVSVSYESSVGASDERLIQKQRRLGLLILCIWLMLLIRLTEKITRESTWNSWFTFSEIAFQHWIELILILSAQSLRAQVWWSTKCEVLICSSWALSCDRAGLWLLLSRTQFWRSIALYSTDFAYDIRMHTVVYIISMLYKKVWRVVLDNMRFFCVQNVCMDLATVKFIPRNPSA